VLAIILRLNLSVSLGGLNGNNSILGDKEFNDEIK